MVTRQALACVAHLRSLASPDVTARDTTSDMARDEAIEHWEYPVPCSLEPFVRRFLHSRSRAPTSADIPVPPSGDCYVTHVAESRMWMKFSDGRCEPCPSVFIGGQLQRELPVGQVRGQVALVGAELRPTALYRFFGAACSQFTDCIADIRVAASRDGASLMRALAQHADPAAKREVLTEFLLKWARNAAPPSRVDQAVATIEATAGRISVEALARRCDWSARHLHRRFRCEVGIGPKLLAKIFQLNHAITAIRDGDPVRLQHVAQSCGFYDQAQFIRDFQRFVGTNPVTFLRHRDPFLHIYLGQVSTAVQAPGRSADQTQCEV